MSGVECVRRSVRVRSVRESFVVVTCGGSCSVCYTVEGLALSIAFLPDFCPR